MSDPKRLAEDGGPAMMLLASARTDHPSDRARKRTAAALGLDVAVLGEAAEVAEAIGTKTASTGSATGGSAATGSAATGLAAGGTTATGLATTGLAAGGAAATWVKLATVAFVGVSAITAGVLVVEGNADPSGGSSTPALVPATNASSAAPVRPPAPSVSAAPAEVEAPPETAPVPAPREAPSRRPETAPRSADRTAPPPPPSAAARTELAREIQSLDDIRSQLAHGELEAASAGLDRHALEFSEGALKTEASMLRIEALLARGEPAKAQELAKELLTREPSGPHARRLRSILEQDDRDGR